jgi:hypothetical protein
MENNIIARQIINFHKSAFDNTFNSLTILQQQMEKMVQTFIQQSTWLPVEGKAAINEWSNICNKGRCDFKEAVDKNYKKVEEYFAAGESVVVGESTAKTEKTKTSKTT